MQIEDIVKIVIALGGSANVGLLIRWIFRYILRKYPKSKITRVIHEDGTITETETTGY